MTRPAPSVDGAPPILYGTAWKKERTASLVERALELGFRGIDTACQPKHYDEPGVGRGVTAALSRGIERSELYLQTKFTPLSGQDRRRVPYDPEAPVAAQVEASCSASLRNLGVSYLDALLMHSPIPDAALFAQAWRAMEELVLAGKVHRLGISNCYDVDTFEQLWQLAQVKPAIVQNRFYAQTGHDRALRELCRSHGVRYQSFWTLTANSGLLAHPALTSLADRHSATAAQIFFRYLTLRDVTPLTGTTSEQHMREDLAIFELDLGELELEAIDRLLLGSG
jgi:diketogulonate reductase-like aldo/keto reductase